MYLYTTLLAGAVWIAIIGSLSTWSEPTRDKRQTSRRTIRTQNPDAQCPRSPESSAGQCPCLRDARGQYMCVAYDPTYQAASVEEAASHFYDTTAADPKSAKPLVPNKKCSRFDTKCKDCTKFVYGELLKETKAFNDNSLWNETINQVLDYFNNPRSNTRTRTRYSNPLDILMNGLRPNSCPLQVFSNQKSNIYNLAALPNVDITGCVKHAEKEMRRLGSMFGITDPRLLGTASNNFDKLFNNRNIFNPAIFSRQKRDVEMKDIDHMYTIKCDNRGQPVDVASEYINLCNICWKWGVLRSGLYPKYINLMTCDSDSSSKCLSGWGDCKQRYRSYQVLEKTTRGYKPYSINIPIACDCQVKAGSALHKFVAA